MQRNIADVRNQRLEDFVMQIFLTQVLFHIYKFTGRFQIPTDRERARERERWRMLKHVSVVSHFPQFKRADILSNLWKYCSDWTNQNKKKERKRSSEKEGKQRNLITERKNEREKK